MHLFKVQMEVLELKLVFFTHFSHFFSFFLMEKRKSNDQVECPQTKFQQTNIKS